jgi:hypothetical protein
MQQLVRPFLQLGVLLLQFSDEVLVLVADLELLEGQGVVVLLRLVKLLLEEEGFLF